jgi:hypothetical protein
MKKIIMMLTAAGLIQVAQAQKSNVESAAIYLRNSEIADAKKAIDEAAIHDETKNDPKMWYYRTAIYDTILRNKDYSSLVDGNTIEKFVLAAKGCVSSDEKKRYEWYCANQAIIQSSFDAYNAAFTALQEKDYDKAVKFFEYVIANIALDKDGQLKKNNLTDKNIYNAIYRSAFVDGKFEISRTYSKKLIDMDYNDPLIYYFNAETYLQSGDTTKALEIVSIGRNKFTNDKDLINYELNIYLKQGKSDVLLNKVNEALSGDPDNSTLIYVRGNIYDKFAADKYNAAEKAQDEAEKLERKAKNEKVPANKPKLMGQSKKQSVLADSLMKEMRAKAILAEADYKRKIELDPENVDGHYAMGALLNNYENSIIVNKINKTTGVNQQEYDKKIAALQKEQRAILERALKHFTDALAIVENMPEVDEDKKREKKTLKIMVLESIKSVYKNMNNELKFMEIKKQIDEIE